MISRKFPAAKVRATPLSEVAHGNLRTISITDTQRRITDLEKTLDAAIKDDDQPRSEALLEPFWDLVEGTGTGLWKSTLRS